MKKLNIIFILFLTLISISLISAEPPCQFYGTITINGDNNNFYAESVIPYIVDGENEVLAEFNYSSPDIPIGNYGIEIYNIGSEIIFKINNENVNQESETCVQGNIELDLTATVENFEGNSSDVETNLENSSITVGNSSDLSQGFFGEQEVVIKEEGSTRVKFNYDFDSNKLDLSSMKITKQDNTSTKGSIEISGINLSGGETKTVYIDNLAGEDYVCILDEEDASVSEMTEDCSGTNEIPVPCDGVETDGYTCTDLGDVLEVTGLSHSAVGESSYSPPSPPSSGSSGGGGGGGGGSSSSSTTSCTEDWSCSDWSECLDKVQTRVCLDSNNCGTINSQPETARTCETEESSTGNEENETQEQGGTGNFTGAVIGALGKGNAFVLGILLISAIVGVGVFLNKRRK